MCRKGSKRFRQDILSQLHLQEMTYEHQRLTMPERFDFKNLENIFSSWCKALNNDITKLPDISSATMKKGVVYQHDHHVYLSDHYVSHYVRNGVLNTELRIKLANNGFIYAKPLKSESIDVFMNAPPRHRSTTLVKLDNTHLSKLQKLTKFARDYLGTSEVSVKMFYDFSEDRFDIRAFDTATHTKGILITFEHLPIKDDDYWLDVEVDDIGTDKDTE